PAEPPPEERTHRRPQGPPGAASCILVVFLIGKGVFPIDSGALPSYLCSRKKEPQGGFFHECSCDLSRSPHPPVLRPGPRDPADHPAHRPGGGPGGPALRRPLRGRHCRRRRILAGPPDGDAPRRPAGTLPAVGGRPPAPFPPAALLR